MRTDKDLEATFDSNLITRTDEEDRHECKIHLGETAFMNDLRAMAVVDDWDKLVPLISDFTKELEAKGFQVNHSKLEITARAFGPGAATWNKQIGNGRMCLKVCEHTIRARKSAKYLGALTSADGSANDEIDERIKSARKAHHRLTLRIWRSNAIQLHAKLRLWKTLVRTMLLYALEVRVLTHQQLVKLERFQMKCLRHITRQPAHISRTSNDEIRERCNTHTIESVLRARRLKWTQHVVRPAFRGADHGYDASLAVRAAIFGTLELESGNHASASARRSQWMHDVKILKDKMNKNADAPPSVAPIPDVEPDCEIEWLRWLDGCSAEYLKSVLVFADERGTNESECALCGEWFQDGRGLKVHRALAHSDMDRETNCAARMDRDALPLL